VFAVPTPQPLIAEHGDGDSVIVDDYLRIKGRTNEYAIGDNASVVDPKTKEPAPLLAASAMQQGETAAENIARSLFWTATDSVPASQSHTGWLLWRVVHLTRLTNLRNQLATALDWSVGYLYDVDTAKVDVQPSSKAA
jgi:NADH dehydrogenase FAD-containing subunit